MAALSPTIKMGNVNLQLEGKLVGGAQLLLLNGAGNNSDAAVQQRLCMHVKVNIASIDEIFSSPLVSDICSAKQLANSGQLAQLAPLCATFSQRTTASLK